MNRRSFLKKIGKIGAVALIAPKVLVADTREVEPYTGFGLAPIKKEGELVIEDRYEYLMSQGWVNHSGVFGWNGT